MHNGNLVPYFSCVHYVRITTGPCTEVSLILFKADVPHAYRNPSTTEQATMYLVMTYADTIG